MRRILVTGASTWVGTRLVRALERRAGVTVFAVDEIPPAEPLESEFRTMSLDRLEFAHYLLGVRPHTVVHLQTIDRSAELGADRVHEEAVVGSQALFGAIGRCTTVTQIIVRSDSAVYGAGPRNPSVLGEATVAHGRRHRHQRDLEDMERHVLAMAAVHEHVHYTILRPAPLFGPDNPSALTRYLKMATVPTRMGFDPRLQFLHEDDAVDVYLHLLDHPTEGVFNLAAPGQLYLSRVLRLGRRLAQPLPRPAFRRAQRGLARAGRGLPASDVDLLQHGRVMDTTRMRRDLGFVPRYTCRQTVLSGYGRHPEGGNP